MTIKQKIFKYLLENYVINSKKLRKKFPKYSKTKFHNSVMRIVRNLYEDGYIIRIERGLYKLPKYLKRRAKEIIEN